jgi:polysaccharide biosynthesis protein PslH
LLSFIQDEHELERAHELEPYCSAVHAVRLPPWRSVLAVAGGSLRSSDPLQVMYYRSAAFRRRLDELVARERFDLVHAYFHRTAPYAAGLRLPRVLELMDSMRLRMERHVAVERAPKRWLFREELRRIAGYELETARRFDRVLVVSEQDREQIPLPNVTVVPNGVDATAFAPRLQLRRPEVVVFSGNMSYEPNVRAVTWFAERVLPLVRRAVPGAVFEIVGSRPSREVRELERLAGVRVSGYVESMPDALNGASVAVAPMRSGSGIQNKVLEAMACALPIVTTSIGRGSIAARPGVELAVADGEEAFADAVAGLLSHPAEARAVGEAARAFVLEHHTWEAGADQINEIYSEIVHTRSSGGAGR